MSFDITENSTPWAAPHRARTTIILRQTAVLIGLALLILTFAVQQHPAMAQTNQQTILADGDVINIEVLERPDLSGTFQIRNGGEFSMHRLGSVRAAGLSLFDLELKMSQELGQLLSLDVSVLVQPAELRPIYVIGRVASPGSFRSRPGTSVIQAISRAGGVLNSAISSPEAQLEENREIAALKVELTDVQLQISVLDAVIIDSDGLVLSEETVNLEDPDLRQLLRDRSAALRTSIEADRAEEKRLNALSGMARTQALQHGAAKELLQQRILARQSEVERVEDLVTRGLATRERLGAVRDALDSEKTALLETQIAESQAKQQAEDLASQVAVAKANQIAEASNRLAELETRRLTLKEQLELLTKNQYSFADRGAGIKANLFLTVFRANAPSQPEAAKLDTLLFPGDVLEVIINPNAEQ